LYFLKIKNKIKMQVSVVQTPKAAANNK